MTLEVAREQVMRYRARVTHLHEKLAFGSFAQAAWGGLQDSVPRGGVMSLHARVEATLPDSWEDPSVCQIWFRGGADYVIPRADVGIFTLGSHPRDADQSSALEKLADDVHRVTDGRILKVREVQAALGLEHPTMIRTVAVTGRALIRWDASNIWLIPVDRPDVDAEDARLGLARRFMHWLGPQTKRRMANWTGAQPRDATATWKGIEKELVAVDVLGDVVGEQRFMLASDVDALTGAEPVRGVRLTPLDDPFTKLDKELFVPDDELRRRVLPAWGQSPGYIPGCVIVDGEIVGGWQRQQRKVTIHPFGKLSAKVREAIEAEALSFPISAKTAASVRWG